MPEDAPPEDAPPEDPAPRDPALDASPLALEAWLPYRLFIVSARVAGVLEGYYGPTYGLTQASWRTLAVIGDRPGLSAGEIARAAGLDQFATSRTIAHLMKLGFAERASATRDRRRASLSLTRAGTGAFADIARLARGIEDTLESGLSAAERRALDGALARLDEASAALAARGWRGLEPR
ncbi:MarR family winged helix-turn-helix transcriptional regulator [Salinarimonas rosea]|uniref:MarR family winged helix-turn-helix transcriptional regulator n=1 Tax=Salinarimonas rosea TaxID=552063 RepID=UPI000416E2DB|nr:MarR family transcriptional regulator [Salinarimonas rosea]